MAPISINRNSVLKFSYDVLKSSAAVHGIGNKLGRWGGETYHPFGNRLGGRNNPLERKDRNYAAGKIINAQNYPPRHQQKVTIEQNWFSLLVSDYIKDNSCDFVAFPLYNLVRHLLFL